MNKALEAIADLLIVIATDGRFTLQRGNEAPGPLPILGPGEVIVANIHLTFITGWQYRCCSMDDVNRVFRIYFEWRSAQHESMQEHNQLRWYKMSLPGETWQGPLPIEPRFDSEREMSTRTGDPSPVAKVLGYVFILPVLLFRALTGRKK